MRRRLAVSFILLALGVSAASFALRTATLLSSMHQDEREEVHTAAASAAAAISAQQAAERQVTVRFLATFGNPDQLVRFHQRTQPNDIVAIGGDFSGSADPSRSNDLWAAEDVDGGFVIVSQSRKVVWDLALTDRWFLLGLAGFLIASAGLAGYLIARAMAAPFRQLAEAATALGRGRFDLDLPISNIPEVKVIAAALDTSATQVADRIAQEQSFAEHASHVLRTPLTSLRLDLDDLAMTGSIPEEMRETLERCLRRIDTLDAVAGELVQLARRGPSASSSELTLHELAAVSAQRWAAELAHHDRSLELEIAGASGITYTPGPLEHLQELLLVDLLHRSRGDVELAYTAAETGALRIRVVSAAPARSRGRLREPGSTFLRARAVATALGGRLEGDQYDAGIDLFLPRR